MLPIAAHQTTMWILERRWETVRLRLLPLPLAGMTEPVRIHMDFDAVSVDAILERLTILRGQMLPPLPAPHKRN